MYNSYMHEDDYVTCMQGIQCQVDNIYIKVCKNLACINATGISADGRRVRATFTSLKENMKYTATVEVQYNGGVVQQSHPVEISENITQTLS